MAGSLNKVLLIGRLGADPEVKQMVNGKNVARLSLATSQSWKDKNSGERKEKTEWHRIVIFNEGLVNVVQQYLKKGANVYVEGQLSTRKWKDESSGQDKYSTEIVLQGYNSSLTMLDSRNCGNNSNIVSENNGSKYWERLDKPFIFQNYIVFQFTICKFSKYCIYNVRAC